MDNKTLNYSTEDLLQPLWNDAMACIRIEVLKAAIELGFFQMSWPLTVNEITENTSLSIEEAHFFLMILWSMNILERDIIQNDEQFNCKPFYLQLFDRQKETYFSDALVRRIDALKCYAEDIQKLVQHQNIVKSNQKNWEEAGRKHLYQDQKLLIAPLANQLVQKFSHCLSFNSIFLDLGGNPGNIAISLIEHFTGFQGVIFDLEETQTVIQENIRNYGYESQLTVQSGVFPNCDLGINQYDFIWCSQLFYFIEDINLGLLQLKTALKPGGLLFFAHAEIPQDATIAGMVLPWYRNMLINNMNILNEGKWSEKLHQLDFTVLMDEYSYSFPVSPLKLIVAKK